MQKVAKLNSLSSVDPSGQRAELGQPTSPQHDGQSINSSPNQQQKEKYTSIGGSSDVNQRLAAGTVALVTEGWVIFWDRWR